MVPTLSPNSLGTQIWLVLGWAGNPFVVCPCTTLRITQCWWAQCTVHKLNTLGDGDYGGVQDIFWISMKFQTWDFQLNRPACLAHIHNCNILLRSYEYTVVRKYDDLFEFLSNKLPYFLDNSKWYTHRYAEHDHLTIEINLLNKNGYSIILEV